MLRERREVSRRMSNPERLLEEISKMLFSRLEEREGEVQKVVSQLEVDEVKYKKLIVHEVVGNVIVDAQFAFPPMQNHTPEDVKVKALSILHRKLERDKRLYLS